MQLRLHHGTVQFSWRLPAEQLFCDIGPAIDATYMSDERLGLHRHHDRHGLRRLLPAQRHCQFEVFRFEMAHISIEPSSIEHWSVSAGMSISGRPSRAAAMGRSPPVGWPSACYVPHHFEGGSNRSGRSRHRYRRPAAVRKFVRPQRHVVVVAVVRPVVARANRKHRTRADEIGYGLEVAHLADQTGPRTVAPVCRCVQVPAGM